MSDVRYHTCGRKERYSNRTLAMRVADAQRAQGEDVRAYRCPLCSHFHTGHPPSMETLRRLSDVMRGLA